MPTLEWIGKEKVINHHQQVPHRVLEERYTYNAESSSPSRHRLKKRASERSSGKWMQRPSAGTMLGGSSRHTPAATIMTEDANTEENTAGNSCGAYIETPCKFAACRALVLYHFNRSN